MQLLELAVEQLAEAGAAVRPQVILFGIQPELVRVEKLAPAALATVLAAKAVVAQIVDAGPSPALVAMVVHARARETRLNAFHGLLSACGPVSRAEIGPDAQP